jgi:hypothetical protein
MLSSLASPSYLLAAAGRPEHLISLVDVLSSSLLYQAISNQPSAISEQDQ